LRIFAPDSPLALNASICAATYLDRIHRFRFLNVHEQWFDSRFKGLDGDAGSTMMHRVRAEPAALCLAVGEV
jgi:hypothetical protein